MQKSKRKQVVEEHSSEEEESEEEEEQQEEEESQQDDHSSEVEGEEVDDDTKKTDAFRRELRAKIIASVNEADKNIEKLTKPGDKEIIHMFGKMKAMEKNIVHAREGALESALFEQLSKHSIQQLKAITLGKEWDPTDFLIKLDEKFGKQRGGTRSSRDDSEDATYDIDWNSVGSSVTHIFKRTPTVTFMHGPLSTERKERKKKERTKRTRDEVTEEKQAEEFNEQSKEDATTRAVGKLFKTMKSNLKKRKGNEQQLSLPDIVVDPTSFCHTIENIFYFSFLVKEGKVSLELDKKDGQLKSRIITDEGEDESKRNQSIMALNLNMFYQLVQKTQAYSNSNNNNGASSSNVVDDGEEE
ncbi:hypothetical protein NAEGRDRAFT_78941 [Naegleria gruberi]|uniref:Non-structural maintenance of chromosomes element 4 n=1 Tax=Naegleria gruberi TaxID=5762 RepID=D2V7V1_NAEGR|nr:uncharacterized protein NAEGRDRAFT_78941 [Naegleria gruberi]EFC47067.1 hypothetical protein NAEGRDRAFT_78941 [Naegleria gruberi]|eukprot:XP_002679811.1 hypothetical protein NAEGRDRAFT_78941 [Naegleria gruberi strain NEG-M]